ncbi:MAG: hypothetical protein KF908_05135 [Nitrosomonas sp.]|nr:hypothetical protein [Nitrosomonas sp.]
MKYTTENIKELVHGFVCSDGKNEILSVESIDNHDIPALLIKQINIGAGYSMLISILRNSNEVHKYNVMYTRYINRMSKIEKIHAVI